MGQFFLNGLSEGALAAIVAAGFSLILNTSKAFHLAHGAIFVVGGYVAYFFSVILGLPLWGSIPLSLFICALFGVGIELMIYAPLRVNRRSDPSGMTFLVSSLGVYIALTSIVAVFFGANSIDLQPGADKVFHLSIGVLTRTQVAQILSAISVMGLLSYLIFRTRLGMVLRATSENAELVSLFGINPKLVILIGFAIGSGLAGFGGVLQCLDTGIDPNSGFRILLLAASAVIASGAGRYIAPMVVAIFIEVIRGMAAGIVPHKWSGLVAYSLIVAILISRPTGVVSGTMRKDES